MKNLGNVGFPGILLNQQMPWKRVGGTEFQCFTFKKYQRLGFFFFKCKNTLKFGLKTVDYYPKEKERNTEVR